MSASSARAAVKRAAFAALDARPGAFVLANAWDAGSARVLAALGAEAIATTSAGWAFTQGRADGTGDLAAAVAHAAELDAAVAAPVSADLENGYGDAPEAAATAVRAAAAVGIAGCGLEDATLGGGEVYDRETAVARMAAAAAAARAASTPDAPFLLTARADGVMLGRYDLDEAIARLRAFEAVGADVLYAPVPGDLAAQARICAAVSRPVNALAAGALGAATVGDLAAVGVRRVSLGSTLARLTHAAICDAAARVLAGGAADPDRRAASGAEIDRLLARGAG